MALPNAIHDKTPCTMYENHRVERAPSAVYYIPDFVTVEEENRLWHCIYTAPKPKWTVLSHRRLQNWGGLPHSKGMVPETLPQWLSQYTDRVSALGVFGEARTANHVLVNEYTPGQGIMAHVDGPLFYPTISTLNIGGHTLLNLYTLAEEGGEAKSLSERFLGSLLLEPRSLLVLQQDAYTATLHDIADTDTDLVCRDRVFNWDQTVLGRWAMTSSHPVNDTSSAMTSSHLLNDTRSTMTSSRLVNDTGSAMTSSQPVVKDATVETGLELNSAPSSGCGEKACVSSDSRLDFVDVSREGSDMGKDEESDVCNSEGETSKVHKDNVNGTVENSVASESMKRNGGETGNEENELQERGLSDLVNFIKNQFKNEFNSLGIKKDLLREVDDCSNGSADGASTVNKSSEHSEGIGSAQQRKDAMYSLEVKLAGCESAFKNKTNSDKSDSHNPHVVNSVPLSDVLYSTDDTPTTDSVLTAAKNKGINASELFADDASLRIPKCSDFNSTKAPPEEVCLSLAGPGHNNCSAPAVEAMTVAGKQYFALPRGTRISLTIRNVPKVIKTKIFLGRR